MATKPQQKIAKILSIGVVAISLAGCSQQVKSANEKSSSTSQVSATSKTSKVKTTTAKKTKLGSVDWQAPSEQKAYPTINYNDQVKLKVSLAKQRVYIYINGKKTYTMYASTGADDTTPKGTFVMESDRGTDFYNPEEQMGANYWSSFKDQGVYMFHSVPTDVNGNYITAEAKYLGVAPRSHGCVRLSVPDAKWVMENIPTGAEVEIK